MRPPEPIATASAKFDLSLGLIERRGGDGAAAGIEGVLEYASDLFERASVEALGQRLVRLLEGAVADPDRALGSLEILEPAERDTILRVWNDTAHWRLQPLTATLPATLFAAQAARTPDAVAVIFEDRTLSYAALDAHANRLAHHLQRPRRRARCAGRGLRRALARDGGGAAGHPQGRRRLSAARSGVSGRAADRHGVGCGACAWC